MLVQPGYIVFLLHQLWPFKVGGLDALYVPLYEDLLFRPSPTPNHLATQVPHSNSSTGEENLTPRSFITPRASERPVL